MIENLTDAELVVALKLSLAEERRASRRFLAFLLEFARRGLHSKTEHATLFVYCTRELGLSEGDAYRRIRAMEAARSYPLVLEMLEKGRLHLSAIAALCAHLTPQNHKALLAQAEGLSKREVEWLVSRLPSYRGPGTPRDAIVPLPLAPAAARAAAEKIGAASVGFAAPTGPRRREEPPRAPASAARVSFVADAELLADLKRARELLGHAAPGGELGPVFKAALKALLDRRDPERWPESKRLTSVGNGRRIPKWVRKAVYRRDGGRCSFETHDGRRCQSRTWLEYDHIVAFALGGRSDDPENIRLLCRAHNQRAARELFGDAHVDKRIAVRRDRTLVVPGDSRARSPGAAP